MRHKYTKELLEPIVASSNTWAQVCRKLGVTPATGAQSHITKKAKLFELDSTHFTGQGWSKGTIIGYKRPIEEYLILGSTIKSHTLKNRLIREGLKKHCCEKCGTKEWMKEKVPIELDHINRNHYDNRLENLMILCPNCHAQKTNKDRSTRG